MLSCKPRTFDPKTFLAQAGLGRIILRYPKNKVIFTQGEPGDAGLIHAGQRGYHRAARSRGLLISSACPWDASFL